jgi:hypothetical protein
VGAWGSTREGNGGVAQACHVEERKWEREGGSGGQQRGAKDVAGNGRRLCVVALLHGQGRAAGRGQRGVCATDRWGRTAMGLGGQRRGVGGRGVSKAAR